MSAGIFRDNQIMKNVALSLTDTIWYTDLAVRAFLVWGWMMDRCEWVMESVDDIRNISIGRKYERCEIRRKSYDLNRVTWKGGGKEMSSQLTFSFLQGVLSWFPELDTSPSFRPKNFNPKCWQFNTIHIFRNSILFIYLQLLCALMIS